MAVARNETGSSSTGKTSLTLSRASMPSNAEIAATAKATGRVTAPNSVSVYNPSASSSGGEAAAPSKAYSGVSRIDPRYDMQKIVDQIMASRDSALAQIQANLTSSLNTLSTNLTNQTGSLDDTLTAAEALLADSTQSARVNRSRERQEALAQAALQGAGESDTLRASQLSSQNFDANIADITSNFWNTDQSIRSALSELNASSRTAWDNLLGNARQSWTTISEQADTDARNAEAQAAGSITNFGADAAGNQYSTTTPIAANLTYNKATGSVQGGDYATATLRSGSTNLGSSNQVGQTRTRKAPQGANQRALNEWQDTVGASPSGSLQQW